MAVIFLAKVKHFIFQKNTFALPVLNYEVFYESVQSSDFHDSCLRIVVVWITEDVVYNESLFFLMLKTHSYVHSNHSRPTLEDVECQFSKNIVQDEGLKRWPLYE